MDRATTCQWSHFLCNTGWSQEKPGFLSFCIGRGGGRGQGAGTRENRGQKAAEERVGGRSYNKAGIIIKR